MKIMFLNCWQELYPEEGPELTCVFLDSIAEVKKKKCYTETELWEKSLIDCYVHNGQHVSASIGYLSAGKPVTEEEYKPLLNELHFIGYGKDELEVCHDEFKNYL